MRKHALLAMLVAIAVMAAACTSPAPKPSLEGSWVAQDTAGKSGTLSDLILAADGTFTYTGLNALGVPVRFAGTYQKGTSGVAPWIRLTYADFPDRPTKWFYRLEPQRLTVSTAVGNLRNGSALVFTRR